MEERRKWEDRVSLKMIGEGLGVDQVLKWTGEKDKSASQREDRGNLHLNFLKLRISNRNFVNSVFLI